MWCHGDWITITDRGSCVITGRSDATLNRGGVRLGTSEFYAVVEAIPGIADSLVVHLEDAEGGAGRLVLFVQLDGARRPGRRACWPGSRATCGRALSPRHVPDDVYAVPAIPRTHSGKKLEVPVKRILGGAPLATRGQCGGPRRPGCPGSVRRDRSPAPVTDVPAPSGRPVGRARNGR